MTKIVELLEYLKKYPVFDSIILNNKLDKSKEYINLFVHRLKKSGKIFQIEKNKYTLYDDPFLIASLIVWPSYISCWSALKFYNLTEQIPNYIWVVAVKNKKALRFMNTKIAFINIKKSNFFGYNKVKYKNFDIFIAEPEKAIIDSMLLRKISFSEISEIINNNIKKLKINKLIKHSKKTENKSLIKRIGYVIESLGYDYSKKLKKYIDSTYAKLDYSKEKIGEKNIKWRLIINA